MKILRMMFLLAAMILSASSLVIAADFDWIKDFNIQAEADSSGFRAGLATRFKIGDAEISAVLGNVQNPADAYMVFRLGEIAHQPVERVLGDYKKSQGKGWGVIAKGLGIKPGSPEFHALKQGDYGDVLPRKQKDQKNKSKGGNGKGKGKK
jgi:hypothetical protein